MRPDRPIALAVVYPEEKRYLAVKRCMDITLGSIALVLLLPVFAIVALLVKLDSPGPVIFAQQRVGYNRRTRSPCTFVMYKFRSMYHQCDQSLHEQHIREWVRCRNFAASHDGTVKLTGDHRVTRIGRVIRRASIDELPQLWNVLLGDMSLVGPRPVPSYEVAEYESWHCKRLEAKPGITGLWQVKARGRADFEEMIRLDIEYVEKVSFWLDLRILALTIPAVLSVRGAG